MILPIRGMMAGESGVPKREGGVHGTLAEIQNSAGL